MGILHRRAHIAVGQKAPLGFSHGGNELVEHLLGVGGAFKHSLNGLFRLFLHGEAAGDAFGILVEERGVLLNEKRAFRRRELCIQLLQFLELLLRGFEVLLSLSIALRVRGFKENTNLHGREQEIALHGIEDRQLGDDVAGHAFGNGAAFGHGPGSHVRDDAGEEKKNGKAAADLLRQSQAHTSSTGYACRLPFCRRTAFPGSRSL